MRHTSERGPATGPASKAVLGLAVAFSILIALACSTSSPPNTAPPVPKVLQMPGYPGVHAAGRGMAGIGGDGDPNGTFSKKWGGFGRWLIGDQRRAEISVTALLVPPDHWSLAGDELRTFLSNEYALDSASAWPRPGRPANTRARTYQYQTREEPLTAPRKARVSRPF